MRRQRGMLLIMVLLLCVLLVTLGFGFLGSRVGQYQSTAQVVLAAQARALARSGIEDARLKQNKDSRFPPPPGVNQGVFSYTEDLLDHTGARAGSYRVNVDNTYDCTPYWVISIRSTGLVGPAGVPVASHTYRATLDVDPGSPTYFQIIRWDDEGSL